MGEKMKSIIEIRTKKGKMIKRMAEIIDYIDIDGNQFAIAYVGRASYKLDMAERIESGLKIWILV